MDIEKYIDELIEIEAEAADKFGDEEIDMVFETVNIRLRDLIYYKGNYRH